MSDFSMDAGGNQESSHTAFLLRTGEVLVSAVGERAILKALAGVAVESFCDWCTVHLVRSDGTIENVAAVASSDSGSEITRRLERFSRLAPDAPLLGALRTARVQLHERVSADFLTRHLAMDQVDGEFLCSLGVHSLMVVPIVAREVVIGAIRFIASAPERTYTARDADVACDVARRAALAIDRARLQSDAAASGQSRDLFLATLSHEMKTPLTSILGWTRMLRSDGPSSDLFVEALEAIEQSANVQHRLIEDLLDVSRIITGKLHLHFESVDLSRLITDASEMLMPRARENGLHIRVTVDGSFTVYGDETRLRQVIWNLLSNAIKFTPGGGLIEVSAGACDDGVAVLVRDTGRGIRAEVLPHVFDRFHQATVEDSSKHQGLGLGLAIVRNIVELHGGQVTAESEGEGKGAVFKVLLPRHGRS